MTVNEHILREAIRKIILESIRNEKIIFKRKFLEQHPGYKSMEPTKSGSDGREVRLGNKDLMFVVTDDKARELISAIKSNGDPDYIVKAVISPGHPGHKSNKYNTYIVQPVSEEGHHLRPEISVVFGRSTAGQRFEFSLHKQLSDPAEPGLASGFFRSIRHKGERYYRDRSPQSLSIPAFNR